MLFPLLAGVASAAFFLLFFLPLLVANLIESGLEYLVLFVLYFLTTFLSTFSRSGTTFRETWGESIGAGFGITLIVAVVGVVLALAALAVSVPVAAVFPGPGLLLAVLLLGGVVVFTYLLSQTVWGIAKTALYLYAVEGSVPDRFENFDFDTLGGRSERRGSPGAVGTRDTLDP